MELAATELELNSWRRLLLAFEAMRRIAPLVLVLGLCVGCDGADETTRMVLRTLADNHAGAIGWAIAWRMLVFGLLGLLVGLAAFFGLRAAGAMRWDWQHATWVRALAGVVLVLGCAGAGAGVGFWQGALRGAETLIGEGQLASEVLPVVGDAGSLVIAGVYVGGELACDADGSLADVERERLEREIDGFARDTWQLDTAKLETRLAGTQRCAIEVATSEARRWVFERYPALETNAGAELVPWLLDQLAARLLDVARGSGAGEVAAPLADMLARIDEAGARAGDPATITQGELSEHVVALAVVPMIMLPIEHAVAGQRLMCLMIPVLLSVLVVGGFALARYLHARPSAGAARS